MVCDRREPLQPVGRDRLEPHLQREVRDDRREVAVPGALAVAVDRALHLRRSTAHPGERIRDARARVVVQVDRHRDVTAEVLDDLAHLLLDLVRQRAAVRVTQHEVGRAVRCGGFEHAQRELGVAAVAVEEVFGVEQHLHARVPQELDRVTDHRDAFIERGAQRLGDVVVPALPDDAHTPDIRVDEVAQGVVAVDLALDPTRRTERDQRAGVQRELRRHTTEELVVLGIRTRPPGLDVVHAQPVELLGDPELVLDGERDALELRAVPQRRVVDLDRARDCVRHAHTTLCICRPVRALPLRTPTRAPASSGRGTEWNGRRQS